MRKHTGLSAVGWTLITLLFAMFTEHCAAQTAGSEANSDKNQSESMNRVAFHAQDTFMLSARYYPAQDNTAAALLLHDCDHNSEQYEPLLQMLANNGVHALALDLRGFGESVSDDFSHEKVKRMSKDVVTYQGEMAKLSVFWPSDLLTSFNFLRDKVGDQAKIAVVMAGCTASYGITLAESIRVSSFVMITPELSYSDKERYKNLFDIPVLFVSSVHHANTYHTAKELYEWNGDKRSSFQLFKGDRFGHRLVAHQPFLNHNIAGWLSHVLR